MAADFGRPLGSGAGMPRWNSSNNLNHLPLPLNITFDAQHASTEDDTAPFLKHLDHTTALATPVLSSIVMNITPLADPGRWCANMIPAISTQRLSRDANEAGTTIQP